MAVRIHTKMKDALVDEQFAGFTWTEYEIFEILFKSPDWIITREEIMDRLGYHRGYLDRNIDAHIKRIRAKIRKLNSDDAANLKTRYGGGYYWARMS